MVIFENFVLLFVIKFLARNWFGLSKSIISQALRRPIQVHHNIVSAPDNTVCSLPFITSNPIPS